jgi:Double zinc ribbon
MDLLPGYASPMPDATPCPSCGHEATGNFCNACGASLTARTCTVCRTELSAQARFCHRCGHPVSGLSPGKMASERRAWSVAAVLCVLLLGGIVYRVTRSAGQPVAPDMANSGVSSATLPGSASAGRAPDISSMSPRERFDRLFNRVMQAAESGDSATVEQFTPMALGAYQQLDSVDADARYHAAVIHLQVGDVAPAKALADTILRDSPGHLFGYVIRGTAAQFEGDTTSLRRAQRDFLKHYQAEIATKRVEYSEHQPVVDAFKQQAEDAGPAERAGPSR